MPSVQKHNSDTTSQNFIDADEQVVSKADATLRDMRLDLITGALKPGARVKIHELTDRYNVSQTIVREVLPKLAAEGLLVGIAQKGFQVAKTSLADVKELTELRIDLEVPALRLAIEHGGTEWEVGILRAQHMMRKYVRDQKGAERAEQTTGWIKVHADFHSSLIASCPSARRRQYCRILFDQSSRYFFLAANALLNSADNLDSHILLADIVLVGDLEHATKMMHDHIERAYVDVKTHMLTQEVC